MTDPGLANRPIFGVPLQEVGNEGRQREGKHPEVTKLKRQVRTTFKKGAYQMNRGKSNPLERGDCDYLTEIQLRISKTDTEGKENNVR